LSGTILENTLTSFDCIPGTITSLPLNILSIPYLATYLLLVHFVLNLTFAFSKNSVSVGPGHNILTDTLDLSLLNSS